MHIQLASSYQFKVTPEHLVKLKTIRTTKINKKRARIFEQMGLSIQVDNASRQKKIFLSKQTKATSAEINRVTDTSGK